IHASNPSVGHVELRTVPAWVKPVGSETGFDVADLHEFVAVNKKDSLCLHIGNVENFAIGGNTNVLGHPAFRQFQIADHFLLDQVDLCDTTPVLAGEDCI